jgi:RNase P subunit RPR2
MTIPCANCDQPATTTVEVEATYAKGNGSEVVTVQMCADCASPFTHSPADLMGAGFMGDTK